MAGSGGKGPKLLPNVTPPPLRLSTLLEALAELLLSQPSEGELLGSRRPRLWWVCWQQPDPCMSRAYLEDPKLLR